MSDEPLPKIPKKDPAKLELENWQGQVEQRLAALEEEMRATHARMQTATSFKNGSKPCGLCLQPGHLPEECEDYKSVAAKLQRIYWLELCVKCFNKHNGQCNSKVPCRFCKKIGHHTALCKEKIKADEAKEDGQNKPGPSSAAQ